MSNLHSWAVTLAFITGVTTIVVYGIVKTNSEVSKDLSKSKVENKELLIRINTIEELYNDCLDSKIITEDCNHKVPMHLIEMLELTNVSEYEAWRRKKHNQFKDYD
jgi:hypothetical protein